MYRMQSSFFGLIYGLSSMRKSRSSFIDTKFVMGATTFSVHGMASPPKVGQNRIIERANMNTYLSTVAPMQESPAIT